MRAAADLHDVGVAGNDPHILERHAQPFVDQLSEARLVALSVRDRPDDDIDPAVGMHRDLGPLARLPGRGVDVIGDADATTLAALARLGAARGKALPVAELERLFHDLVIGAAVVDHAERIGVGKLGRREQIAAP